MSCQSYLQQNEVYEEYSQIVSRLPERQYFDEVVRIAAEVCGLNMSFICFGSGKRFHFKSKYGIEDYVTVNVIEAECTFCWHLIHQPEVMLVIPDTFQDERFKDYPMVTCPNPIRFYAGVTLITSGGSKLGTLCVVGNEPKQLTSQQKSCLLSMSRQIMMHLEMRKELSTKKVGLFENMADSLPFGVFKASSSGQLYYCNKTFLEMNGITYMDALDEGWISSIHSEDKERVVTEWAAGIEKGVAFELEFRIVNKAAVYFIHDRVRPLILDNGAVEYLCVYDIAREHTIDSTAQDKKLLDRISLPLSRFAVGVWDWNLIKDELVWDGAMFSIYGITPQEFTGSVSFWSEAIHPEDKKRGEEELSQAYRGIKDVDFRFRILRPDGQTRHLCARAYSEFDSTGRPIRMVGINWDVTEEEALKKQIQLKNKKLEAIFSSMKEGILLMDDKGDILEVNPSSLKILRLEKMQEMKDFVKWTFKDEEGNVISMSDLPMFIAMKTRQPQYNVVLSLKRKNEKGVWLNFNATPLYSEEDEQASTVLCTFSDITERKNYEKELEAKEAELSLIFDAMPAMIGHWDCSLKNIHANKRLAASLGCSDALRVKGRYLKDVLDPELYSTSLPFIQAALEGKPQKFEKESTLNGVSHFTFTQLVPDVRDAHVCGYFEIMTDVTDFKLLEKELMAAQEAEKKANAAKSGFLASMSHELRTPLNGIIGMTGLLQGTTLTEEQLDYVETISSSGKSLLSIINDILDFSKIEAGKMDLEAVEFDFAQSMRDWLRPFHFSCIKKNIGLELDIKKCDYKLMGDAGRIGQVVANLLGNAVKFTQKGGVSVKVDFDVLSTDCLVTVAVHDSGIGIPQESKTLLFNAFAQGQSSITRRFGGTGLGLAISKNLIERMNGKIWFDSEYGQGTTFTFQLTLPLATNNKSESIKHPRLLAPSSIPLHYTGKVLIAEDNPTNQKVVEKMLQKRGLEYCTVNNGKEALEALERNEFDLVFMDCQMPEMDGYEATRLIRQDKKFPTNLPIVALTANAIQGDDVRCLECGMTDYIPKPIHQKTLDDVLSKYLPYS